MRYLKLFNESTFNNGLQEICDNNLYFLKDDGYEVI